MDTAQCPQGKVEKKARPTQKEQATNCPRCNSTNTKFCYYNNYSLSQPRYFCKACRRYWTEGGCLRNVPVGGGSRKNKRPSSSSSSSPQILSSKINKVIIPDNNNNNPPNPSKIQHDLNLSYKYPSHYNNNIGMSEFIALPFGLDSKNNQNPSFSNHIHPVMEFFKMGVPNSVYNNSNNSSGFPVLHDFKPFSVDGLENGYGNLQGAAQERDDNNMIFPFGDLKQVQNSDQQFEQQDRGAQGGDQANGFWNGMLAGGGSSSW